MEKSERYLIRYAKRKLKREDDAEDLLQIVYVNSFRAWYKAGFRFERAPIAYLTRAVRNAVTKANERVSDVSLDQLEELGQPLDDRSLRVEAVHGDQNRLALIDSFCRTSPLLSEKERSVLLLYLEEATDAEIEARLRINASYRRKLKSDGKRKLNTALRRAGYAPLSPPEKGGQR